MLGNLANILKKSEEFAKPKNIDGSVLLDARLAPDMFSLAKQVQIACDQEKNGMAHLASVGPPKFDDSEQLLLSYKSGLLKLLRL